MTRPKAILYLVAIFLAGGVAGAVLGWTSAYSKSPRSERREFNKENLSEKMRRDLQTRLGLTAEQLKQVEPILQSRLEEMHAVHRRSMEQIDEVVRRTDTRIAELLTPEQRAKLEQMARDRREFMERRFRRDNDKGPPPGERSVRPPGPGESPQR